MNTEHDYWTIELLGATHGRVGRYDDRETASAAFALLYQSVRHGVQIELWRHNDGGRLHIIERSDERIWGVDL